MKTLLLTTLLFFTSLTAFSQSAFRHEWESMEQASEKSIGNFEKKLDSPQKLSLPYTELDYSRISMGWTKEELHRRFRFIRDIQFIDHDSANGKLRRSSWMYPQNGCWLRAELMNHNLTRAGIQSVSKVFIFGKLKVNTRYSAYGNVTWWYHVAPIVEVEGTRYVLDPAINPDSPTRLEDWIQFQSKVEDVKLSICHADTFAPYKSCITPKAVDYSLTLTGQKTYLVKEKTNLEKLFRESAEAMLTHTPPWEMSLRQINQDIQATDVDTIFL